MSRLAGKVAIVTGSASGIGESCARRLARDGAQVVVADINLAGAIRVANEIVGEGGAAFALRLDLADEASISGFYSSVLERSGRIDVLHNNAAETSMEMLSRDMAIATMLAEVWDRAFTINARGTMLMTKHVIAPMIAGGGGSIINTSSGAALRGDLINPAYAASKAAVNCLTRYVATQYGKQGIRCNVVSPGMILTPKSLSVLTEQQLASIERHKLTPYLGAPEDIAGAVAWLASDDARFVTAQIISIDGGITAHMPQFADLYGDFANDPNQRAMRTSDLPANANVADIDP